MLAIESHEKAINLLKTNMGPWSRCPERIPNLRAVYRTRMEQFWEKLQEGEASRSRLIEKQIKLLQHAKMNLVQRVNFTGFMYKGVRVTVGREEYLCREELKGPASLEFKMDTRTFEVTELKPLECNVKEINTLTPEAPAAADTAAVPANPEPGNKAQ
jgi:hypothetical protein